MPCKNCSCLSCLAPAGSPIPPTESSLLPSELMSTNRAPTDFEVEQSKDMIDSAKKKMLLLQAAMTDLAEQTTRMIQMHKAVTSPLRNFPSELLVAIFAECTDTTKDPWPRFTSPASPFNLMWICSRWRKIVLNTPQLWTRISDSTPTLVDLWLTRSRESLLNLHLDLSSGGANPTLNALIPQAHRWEQVHLALRLDSNSALSHVKGQLHSLKRLKVSCLNTVGTLDFFEEAPQLTEIQLDRVTYPPSIRLPWKQLRNCTLDGWLLTLYTLQQAKNIQTCHLRIDDSYSPQLPTPFADMRFFYSELKTLIVSRWNSQDSEIYFFFIPLTLPYLQTLEFCFPRVTGRLLQSLAQALSGFFGRSSMCITTIKLTSIPFPPSTLIDYLVLMPSLVSLDIGFNRYHSINDNILGCLNFDHPNHLAPCLRSLTLRGQGSFSEESINAFIASRRGVNLRDVGVAALEKLVLNCTIPRDWSSYKPPSFHQFVSEGLVITYGKDWTSPPCTLV